jgi:hypothetical protein
MARATPDSGIYFRRPKVPSGLSSRVNLTQQVSARPGRRTPNAKPTIRSFPPTTAHVPVLAPLPPAAQHLQDQLAQLRRRCDEATIRLRVQLLGELDAISLGLREALTEDPKSRTVQALGARLAEPLSRSLAYKPLNALKEVAALRGAVEELADAAWSQI